MAGFGVLKLIKLLHPWLIILTWRYCSSPN